MRNPKREVEELELASTATSVRKRPRRSVQKRPKDTERERNSTGQVKFLERKLTGEKIRRNIELIWDRLTKNCGCKLGIYGMGGVGKTAIMTCIHNRLVRDATFDGVVFITVSKDFSIHKLQSDIGKTLEIRDMEDEDQMKRAVTLSQCLKRKKNCVLIFDDVWEFLDLKEVGIPDGFKLVLTTRSLAVCHQMQCQETIEIEPLSQGEAESLFLEELGSEVPLNLEIRAIAKPIVKECAGLPIGVITMARSMRGETDVFKWRAALERFKESSMVQTDMEKVLMILKFSYDRLGIPYVQQCFLSCALYPEDELINKSELVEFFIDQGLVGGLIDELNTREKQYNRGLSIWNKLRNVCLLEDHGTSMKKHDLHRDMALHIMGVTSMVKAGKWLMRIPLEEYWTNTLEKVSLMNNNFGEFPLNMSPNCPKLSTLLLNRCLSRNVAIPDSFFKNLLGLKVLNLSGNDMTELPNSISDLVNLRELLLRKCRKLCRITYLGKLTSLRKLDANGCRNLETLKGLEKLVNLRYLALNFSLSSRLPKGVLGGSLKLQHPNIGILEDITKLRELETLECYFEDADDFNKCVRVVEKVNPQYYYLRMNPKCDSYEEEESDGALFRNQTRRVDILGWSHAIVSMKEECTSIFILIPRDVRILLVMECNSITNLSGIGPLEHLEELEIQDSENLEVLCGGRDEVVDIRDSPGPTPTPTPTPLLFPSFWDLIIVGCPKLKYLFGHGSKSNLPHLQTIDISFCKEMVGIIAVVTSPPPHPLPAFPSLEEICVRYCHKMKRAVESMSHFPNLRKIIVSDCENMEEMIGVSPPHVPDEKISLEYLSTYSCNNMRRLFWHNLLPHLQDLKKIYVSYCKGMVEMISGAGQGQEGSIMTLANSTPSSFRSSISPKSEAIGPIRATPAEEHMQSPNKLRFHG